MENSTCAGASLREPMEVIVVSRRSTAPRAVPLESWKWAQSVSGESGGIGQILRQN